MDAIGLPAEWQTALKDADWNLFSSYLALVTLATVTIYAGSFGSVSYKPDPTQRDDDEEEQITERISSDDAKLFPFVASAALLGLFLTITYLGKEWVNWFLGWYFLVMGIGSVAKTLISFAKFLVGTVRWKQFGSWTFGAKKGTKDIFSASVRTPAFFLFLLSFLPPVLNQWYPQENWSFITGNIVGLSFCYNALGLMKLDTFNTGAILLGGLFLYDIWWVFGTRVMVEVATTLDVPIKLLWPKSIYFSRQRGYTLLGLGDIIIPGIFVSLALRYDYSRTRSGNSTTSFPKPYFYATLMAYVLGLVTAMAVGYIFRAAQPALLYLSPACIFSVVGLAVARGEVNQVWNWSDDPKENEDAAGTKEKKEQ